MVAFQSRIGVRPQGPKRDQSKMMGQINLVRIGQEYIASSGSFTLISGILNIKPIPFAIADATTSGAIDTFVKCVSLEIPRNTRINVVIQTSAY